MYDLGQDIFLNYLPRDREKPEKCITKSFLRGHVYLTRDLVR